MASSKSTQAATSAPRTEKKVGPPERKIGPFHNGLGLAIWLNRIETAEGPRFFRSITIAPRRYRDPATGKWKDAASFRPVDLSTLELALAAARQFISSTPLPGQPVEGEEDEEMHLYREDQPTLP